MIKVYQFILRCLKPFVVWWGKLHMPFTHKKVTGKHYYLLRDKIKIGTVFLTRIDGEFSNIINPEHIPHGALYVGDIHGTGVRYVVEALGKGVVLTDLVTFLTTKDLVVGVLPKFLTNEDMPKLQSAALAIKGLPYDYLFSKDKKAFYCFEVVAHVLKTVRPEIKLLDKEIVKGKFIYSYETFLKDYNNFKEIFNSDSV
jgi:hypothetical protein